MRYTSLRKPTANLKKTYILQGLVAIRKRQVLKLNVELNKMYMVCKSGSLGDSVSLRGIASKLHCRKGKVVFRNDGVNKGRLLRIHQTEIKARVCSLNVGQGSV